MSDEEKKLLEVARKLVIAILSSGEPSIEELRDLLEIKGGNNDILYMHVNAISHIFNMAKEILDNKEE